jgi:hypothetical protein
MTLVGGVLLAAVAVLALPVRADPAPPTMAFTPDLITDLPEQRGAG